MFTSRLPLDFRDGIALFNTSLRVRIDQDLHLQLFISCSQREVRIGMTSMVHEARANSGDPHLVLVVVDGLQKGSRSKEALSERVTLPEGEPISALWAKLKCECDN